MVFKWLMGLMNQISRRFHWKWWMKMEARFQETWTTLTILYRKMELWVRIGFLSILQVLLDNHIWISSLIINKLFILKPTHQLICRCNRRLLRALIDKQQQVMEEEEIQARMVNNYWWVRERQETKESSSRLIQAIVIWSQAVSEIRYKINGSDLCKANNLNQQILKTWITINSINNKDLAHKVV